MLTMIFLFLAQMSPVAYAETPAAKYPNMVVAKDYVKDLEVDLKYATADNFAKQILYTDLKECLVLRETAAMLKKANEKLKKIDHTLVFHAYDCLRPRSVQLQMWDVVKGTPSEPYVSDPNTSLASIHNYGCALDITISKKGSGPLDMGVPFDFFGDESHPRDEIQLMAKKKLTLKNIENRLLLRYVMTSAGFIPISNEWWHFNCATDEDVKTKFKIVQ